MEYSISNELKTKLRQALEWLEQESPTIRLEELRRFECLCQQVNFGLKYIVLEMSHALSDEEGKKWALEERIKDHEQSSDSSNQHN